MPSNTIKMNKHEPFFRHSHVKVTRVRLRGGWTTGTHQEVLVHLASGYLIRVSRTNGSDTFQIGAVEEGKSTNPMPDLIDTDVKGVIMCSDVLKAFGDAHRAHPNYEHADCQTFAKNVFLQLAPHESGRFSTGDDDFM